MHALFASFTLSNFNLFAVKIIRDMIVWVLCVRVSVSECDLRREVSRVIVASLVLSFNVVKWKLCPIKRMQYLRRVVSMCVCAVHCGCSVQNTLAQTHAPPAHGLNFQLDVIIT